MNDTGCDTIITKENALEWFSKELLVRVAMRPDFDFRSLDGHNPLSAALVFIDYLIVDRCK